MSKFTETPSIEVFTIEDDGKDLIDLYDDSPITIEDIPLYDQNFNRVHWWRLKQMIERWPAMKKSWEHFIIDYNMCLATMLAEEKAEEDDIPF